MRFGGESVTIARSPSLRNSSGLVDAPDRRVVGAKREYLLCAAYLLTVEHHALRERRSQAPGRATALELAWREACPAYERTREVGLIGVAKVQRDVDDLAGRVCEHPLRGSETR